MMMVFYHISVARYLCSLDLAMEYAACLYLLCLLVRRFRFVTRSFFVCSSFSHNICYNIFSLFFSPGHIHLDLLICKGTSPSATHHGPGQPQGRPQGPPQTTTTRDALGGGTWGVGAWVYDSGGSYLGMDTLGGGGIYFGMDTLGGGGRTGGGHSDTRVNSPKWSR